MKFIFEFFEQNLKKVKFVHVIKLVKSFTPDVKFVLRGWKNYASFFTPLEIATHAYMSLIATTKVYTVLQTVVHLNASVQQVF